MFDIVRACVLLCVRACVRATVRACVRACVLSYVSACVRVVEEVCSFLRPPALALLCDALVGTVAKDITTVLEKV